MKKLVISILLLSLFNSFCTAQFTVIVNFDSIHIPQGQYPTGNVIKVGNLLYGMTSGGGLHDWGCIFSVDTNGTNYKDLWDFNPDSGTNGAYPSGSLILLGGKLYGMTYEGGRNDWGNIFRIDTNGGGYKDLWDFNEVHDSNGGEPDGNLTLSGGKLYGMTQAGGRNDYGNIFRIDTNGSGYKDLWDFNSVLGSNGALPRGSLILSGNKLYGMTGAGGINGFGEVFSIDINGAGYKDLWNFNGARDSNGSEPYGNLTLSGGKLYGMTSGGGTKDWGNIFSIDTNGMGYKDLWDFNQGFSSNGAMPFGSLTLTGGKLYGMTFLGGLNNEGNIFKIDTDGSGYKNMFNFNGTNGEDPNGSLTLFGGVFYGMTYAGGTNGYGVVFSIDTSTVLGINNLKSASSTISIYPNPNNGIFTIQSSGISGQSSVEIYNVLGERVYSGMLKQVQHDYEINLSTQPAGVYLYRVLAEDGSLIGEGKVVIE